MCTPVVDEDMEAIAQEDGVKTFDIPDQSSLVMEDDEPP
jgi:hypothetical protein